MLKLTSLLLIALLLLAPSMSGGTVEPRETAAGQSEAGAYTGQWVTIEPLEIEFFQPEGWTGKTLEANGAAGYNARSADGRITLSILDGGALSTDVDLTRWARDFFGDQAFERANANGQEAILCRAEDSLTIGVPCGGRLYVFNFLRDGEDALSEGLALRIAGSVTDVW